MSEQDRERNDRPADRPSDDAIEHVSEGDEDFEGHRMVSDRPTDRPAERPADRPTD